MLEIEKPKILVEENEDGTFAKFTVEPLERGYGITLGNCLRRTILSALPGAAAVGIRIAGVNHEFSSIKGVKEDANALAAAEKEGVTIKKYDIIYQILEDIEKTMLSLLEPEVKEVELGKAEVRQVFTIGKTTRIAGCYVTEGKIARNAGIRVIRDNVVIHDGKLISLKRFKDDAKEVNHGYECGLQIENYNDIVEGDTLEVYVMEEVKR